jgi:hypothetical protein
MTYVDVLTISYSKGICDSTFSLYIGFQRHYCQLDHQDPSVLTINFYHIICHVSLRNISFSETSLKVGNQFLCE